MSNIKFYDNGTSMEVGVPAEDRSRLDFDSKYDNDEKSFVSISISKREVKELIKFLENKFEEMEWQEQQKPV